MNKNAEFLLGCRSAIAKMLIGVKLAPAYRTSRLSLFQYYLGLQHLQLYITRW